MQALILYILYFDRNNDTNIESTIANILINLTFFFIYSS